METDWERWFRVFVWCYALYYCWVLYKVVKGQLAFLNCKTCSGGFLVWAPIVNALFLTVIFVCLLKNRRWAWILLLVSIISAAMTWLVQVQTFYKYRNYISPDAQWLFVDVILPYLFIGILWRPAIATFFGVSKKDKRRAAWAGVVLGIVYVAILEVSLS